VELAGPEPTIVLASDHGFGPSSDVFYVNAWLEEQGYLTWADEDLSEAADTPQLGFGQMTRHVFQLDWSRTVAYAATPSSQGIHVVRRAPNGEAPPMPDETYQRLVAEIADGLLQVRHPVSGRPVVSEVQLRAEAFAGPYEELAPDVSFLLEDGAAVSILRSETLVRTRDEPSGNHRPEGIFVAAGPSLGSGEALGELSIVDVAPLILYTLDVPVPLDMSGRVPEEAFEPDELERRPPRYVAGAAPEQVAQSRNGEVGYDSEDEATILTRLRALGYVE
jgi:predicted AlkP superfamily phosphohydrolase/phosphomutase